MGCNFSKKRHKIKHFDDSDTESSPAKKVKTSDNCQTEESTCEYMPLLLISNRLNSLREKSNRE